MTGLLVPSHPAKMGGASTSRVRRRRLPWGAPMKLSGNRGATAASCTVLPWVLLPTPMSYTRRSKRNPLRCRQ